MAKQPWLRLYTAILDSPKIQMLPDRLYRACMNLWCVAKENEGRLPPASTCAWRLRVPEPTVKRWIADLTERRLLDQLTTGDIVPHDWNEHQYEITVTRDVHQSPGALRQKRYRDRHRNGQNGANGDADGVTVTRYLAGARGRAETEQNPPAPFCVTCGGHGALFGIGEGALEQWQPNRSYTKTEVCSCKKPRG